MHDFYKKHVILKKIQEIKLHYIVVLVLDMLCKKIFVLVFLLAHPPHTKGHVGRVCVIGGVAGMED
jgi:hypothetical protein